MYIQYDYSNMFAPDEVLVYLRKSRSDDPLLSVEEVLRKHESILNEWVERNLSAKIPEENIFREIISGETIADRPEIQKLLSKIESPKYKAILCVEVQRLSRGDLEDAGRLIKLLRYTNTFVITPPKTYDLQDEYDRDIFERELKRGNEFLEYQKKIMGRGRLLSVSQGNYINSMPPYGYDKVWVMDGKRKVPTLAENKEQADVVRLIYDLYVNKNMGYKRICDYLENLNIKPPKGKYWSPSALKDLLRNVHYIGKVKWNWRKTVTIVEDGEIVKTRPKTQMGEYLIYDGKHQAIISEEIFNLAQEKLGKNPRIPVSKTIVNPFAGVLYCHCGRAMLLRFNKTKDGFEKNPPRLMCTDQTHCKTGSCLFSDMIDEVCRDLEEYIDDFEVKIENQDENSEKLHLDIIKNLEKSLKDIEAKQIAQWEAQSNPNPDLRMPADIFKVLKEKLAKEKEETKKALEQAYNSIPTPIDYEERISSFRNAISALKNDEVSAEAKNTLLKACVERIDYYRDAPERLRRAKNERKGATLPIGGGWTETPIELDIKVKI